MVETSTNEKINMYFPFDYESQIQWNQQNKRLFYCWKLTKEKKWVKHLLNILRHLITLIKFF